MEDRFVILAVGSESIKVALQHGLEITHKGSAVVESGHLYLRGNPVYTNCETAAVYAPGQWLSATLERTASDV